MNTNFNILLFCMVLLTGFEYSTPASLREINFAKKYLRQFHYISPLKNGNHDFRTALELFQEFMRLPVTGVLDEETIKEMNKPRCGFPDIEEDLETSSPHSPVKRYSVSPSSWSHTNLTYGVFNTGNDMTPNKVKKILKRAFKMWSDNTVLNFKYVIDVNVADIKISFGSRKHGSCFFKFDGPGEVLAHAFFPKSGSIHFDDDEHFTDGTSSGINLLYVAVHEIGHAIGIGHSSHKGSVMRSQYNGYEPNLSLHADDINAAAYLYGGATVSPPQVQPTTCSDYLSYCKNFANYCANYPSTKLFCPLTCGACRQSSNVACSDKWSAKVCRSFKNLKNIDYCKKPIIKKNCRKTCHTPGTQC